MKIFCRLFGTLNRGTVGSKSHESQHAGRTGQAGQALAEGALVFLILLLLVAGLVEFGWAYFRYLAMQNAAAEGAAYGVMFPTWHDDTDNPNPNNIAYRVRHESNSPLLDWTDLQVDVTNVFTTPGNLITVTVSYEHELITPLLNSFVGDGTMTLETRAVQSILAPPPSP